MPISRTPALEAVANLRERSRSRWPHRSDSENRIEPVARPHFETSFSFEPGATIFTIGSCFARHIEAALQERGFKVPTRHFWVDGAAGKATDNWMLDNYGVPAIYNEIRWALGIGEPYDPKEQLFEVYPGKFADLHLSSRVPLCSFDDAVSRRDRIFQVNRSIRTADTAIITLGLVEVWWDKLTGIHLNTRPYETVIRAAPDRFEVHVLAYEEIFAQLDSLIAMILEHCSTIGGIIITVSPVPMTSTYTHHDVAVANQYSKAVLRAAAAAIVEKYDRLDYFPSYETVILSDRQRAWTDDLVHVTPEMIEVNVARLLGAYVGHAGIVQAPPADNLPTMSLDSSATDAALESAQDLLRAKQFADALAEASPFIEGPAANRALRIVGQCQFELGQWDIAEVTLRRALSLRFNDPHAHGYLGLALRARDRHDEAIDALQTAVDYSPTIARWTCRLAETLLHAGKYEDGRAIIERGLKMWPDHPGLKRLKKRQEPSLQGGHRRSGA